MKYVIGICVHIEESQSGNFDRHKSCFYPFSVTKMQKQLLGHVVSRTRTKDLKPILERWGWLEQEVEQIDLSKTKREITNSLIEVCNVRTTCMKGCIISESFFFFFFRNFIEQPFYTCIRSRWFVVKTTTKTHDSHMS